MLSTARLVAVIVATAVLCVLAPASAPANVVLTLGTPDTPTPPQYASPAFEGISADGSHLFFTSSEPTAGQPANNAANLYVNTTAGNALVGVGDYSVSNYGFPPHLAAASADGETVAYWREYEVNPFTIANTTFLRRLGVDAPLAAGIGSDGHPTHADLYRLSTDGSRMIIGTWARLLPADEDDQLDLYQEDPVTGLRLLTPGAAQGAGALTVTFCAASPDARSVLFVTGERLSAADHDDTWDVYESGPGGITLRTTASGSDAICYAASNDLSTFAFLTAARLTAGDTDDELDLYATGPAGTRRVARTPYLGNVRVSDDGTRVTFTTSWPLLSSDTDTLEDTYQDTSGLLRRYRDPDARVSADGRTLVYRTLERLTDDDTDDDIDIYEIRNGVTARLISPGALTGYPQLLQTSADARRVIFGTTDSLVSADTDNAYDVYAAGSEVQLLSGDGPGGAIGRGASPDASEVIIDSPDALTAEDSDTAWDLYRAHVTWPAPPADPPGASNPPVISPPTGATAPQPRPQAPNDHRAPACHATAARSVKAGTLQRRGLSIRVDSDEAAALALALRVNARTRDRLGLPTARLASAHASLARPGTTRIRIRTGAHTTRTLRRHRTRATLVLSATDSAQNTCTRRLTVTITG